MNIRIVNMLDDLKLGKYSSYNDYLNEVDIINITNWYTSFSKADGIFFDAIIDLMYILYVRDNIITYPYDEYQRIVTDLSQEFFFEHEDFISLYNGYKEIVFENRDI